MININDINISDLKWKNFFDQLTEDEANLLQYDVDFLARESQLEAIYSTAKTTIMLNGRGWGKSWVLAQIARKWKDKFAFMSYALPSYGEVEKIMVPTFEAVFPDHDQPIFKLHKGFVEFKNGSKCYVVTSESYERIRGLNTYGVLIDELAAFQYPEQTYTQLVLSNRLGDNPRFAIATTPRPSKFLENLLKGPDTKLITGSSYENKLIDTSLMSKLYEGTRLGRQELYGELLLDTPGSLWTFEMIDTFREEKDVSELKRVCIAMDPAVTSTKTSDESGIIVGGIDYRDHVYILDDQSGVYKPQEWARRIISLYDKYQCDRVVVEKNNGGEMIQHTLDSMCDQMNRGRLNIKTVWASRSKMARAEPCIPYYERGLIHHTKEFKELESQLTSWNYSDGQPSPDRLDATVWLLYELLKIGGDDTAWVLNW